jgi:HAD superfamily hydrolase (TIGR01549 family)
MGEDAADSARSILRFMAQAWGRSRLTGLRCGLPDDTIKIMRPTHPARKILAVFLDSGDTIVDEGTEIKDAAGVTQTADLIPGAAETVRALKSLGYPLALVADGPAGTFYNTLTPSGLIDLFDVLAISDQIGADKPDRRIFQHALDALGIQPGDYNRVVMVGNNLARDVKGANALGLISIWLDWAPRRPKIPADPSEQPCYTIKYPSELLDLLAQLESSLP